MSQEATSDRTSRLAALQAQIGTRGQKPEEKPPAQKPQSPQAAAPVTVPPVQPEQSTEVERSDQQKSERKRHTLYYSTSLNTQVDNAFKQVAHDIFPLEIEKADFVEACFHYCLENLGDIQALLQQPRASS